MFHLWLTLRFVTSGRRLLNLPAMLSLIGMTIGVACLTVAMAVVSGFEVTLQKSVQDVFGHVMIVKHGQRIESIETLLARVKQAAPDIRAFTPFLQLEGVIVRDQKLSYIVLQGVEDSSVGDVLNISPRVVRGKFDLKPLAGQPAPAMVGKGLARKFGLEPGQTFKIVHPTPSRSDSTEFSSQVKEFRVTGVLDLGKSDYDERYVVTELGDAQDFAGVGQNFSGLRLRLRDPMTADKVAFALERELGNGYYIMHWHQVNENLFEAIEYERPVIFFVLLVMVVAASFNISSHLFVSVLKKFSDMSILRAMGFSRFDVMKVFTIQGVFFGILGTVTGIVLGLGLCGVFLWLQDHFVLMPADVYKIDHVGVRIRFLDVLAIIAASVFVSLLSTLMPAFRGSRLNPVEGLRYE